MTAYSPLGSDNSPLLKNEVVKRIATKYDVLPTNVLISLHANKPLHTGECYRSAPRDALLIWFDL